VKEKVSVLTLARSLRIRIGSVFSNRLDQIRIRIQWIQILNFVLFIVFLGFLKYFDCDFFSKILNGYYIIVQGEGPVEVSEGPGSGPQPTRQGQALRPPLAAGQGQEMKNLKCDAFLHVI
jgi:hypothetical protein